MVNFDVSVSISGAHTLPEARRAVEHVTTHPSHDVVLFMSNTNDRRTLGWYCTTCDVLERREDV